MMIFANLRALGAVPVVFVALLSVVILLCVRAVAALLRVPLTRSVLQTLDGSTLALFVLFIVLVILRFQIIG
jgi:hypothetical protein